MMDLRGDSLSTRAERNFAKLTARRRKQCYVTQKSVGSLDGEPDCSPTSQIPVNSNFIPLSSLTKPYAGLKN